jgi:hypothetical protein
MQGLLVPHAIRDMCFLALEYEIMDDRGVVDMKIMKGIFIILYPDFHGTC